MEWMVIPQISVAGLISGFLGAALLWSGVPWLWRAIGRRRDQRRTAARLEEDALKQRRCLKHGQMYPSTARGLWWCSQCRVTTPFRQDEWALVRLTNGVSSSEATEITRAERSG